MTLLSARPLAGMVLGLALLHAPAALAQSDLRPLLDRLDRMERDMSTLQRQVYRGGDSSTVITSPALGGGSSYVAPATPQRLPEDAAGRIDVRLSTLEEQIRRLTGQVEENQFRANQVKEQLDRMQADIELRFQELHKTGAPAAAAAAAPPAGQPPQAGAGSGVAGTAAPKEGVLGSMPKKELDAATPRPAPAGKFELKGNTPKEQYEYAYSLVVKDRDQAEKALRAFIDAHPNDQLTSNAYYWLGETLFVKGDFKQAAVQFLEGYRKFPKSQKAPHNLLKLAMSMVKMEDNKGACAALGRLNNEFPDAEAAIKRAAQAEKQKAKCS